MRTAASTALLLTSLLTFSTASPLSKRQAPNYPPHEQSTLFTLVANVTGNNLDPSINGYVLSSYHTGAGTAAAVLIADTTEARVWFENGTAEDVRYGRGSIVTEGATPPVPFGLALPPSDPNANPLTINGGAGTPGIQLTQFPVPVSTLVAPSGGRYIACQDSDLPYGPAIGLYYAPEGTITAPEVCAEVTLLPQCVDDTGATEGNGEGEVKNIVNCYADVVGIDWSVYSAA